MRNQLLLILITLDNLLDSIIDYLFDIKNKVDTFNIIDLTKESKNIPNILNAKKYQGTRLRVFNRIMKNLKINPSDYNFIDIGSGKGKTLIMASRFNFKNITGIELCKPLYDISLINIEKMNLNKKVQIEHTDVLHFTPPKGYNIFYLYNPFNEIVLHNFFSNLLKHNQFGNKDIIIYLNPRYHQELSKLGFDRKILIENFNFNKVALIYQMDIALTK